MNKKLILCLAAATFIFGTYGFAEVTVTAPTVTTGVSAIDTYLNGTAISSAISSIETQANDELAKYDGKQEDLAKGFGNANMYSAQAGTMQGYQGYKLFAVTSGVMVGAQLPSLDPNKISKIPDTIADNPDVYAGIAPSVTYINLGINAEKVFGIFGLGDKLKHIYFNAKFGMLDYTYGSGDNAIDVSSTNFGLGVNYQWLPSLGVLGGFARWRGINFGTGFMYQTSTLEFTAKMDKISQSESGTAGGQAVEATFSVIPNVDVTADMRTFSIPLEASTSIQLFWVLNLNFGVGADLVFGNTDLTATSDSPVTVDSITVDDAPVSYTSTPGKIHLDTGTTGVAPDLARVRLMTGFGAQFGPLKVDVPVYYYLMSGLAVGITGGIVW